MGKKNIKDHFSIILVDSTGHAIQIEKLLLNKGISCKLTPVPRYLSSDCGVCVNFNKAEKEFILKLLSSHLIEYNSVHDI